MKLQNFLVAANPVVLQANGLLAATSILSGAMQCNLGTGQLNVLISVVDYPVQGSVSCTVSLMNADRSSCFGSSKCVSHPNPLGEAVNHAFVLTVPIAIFTHGFYSLVADINGQEFTYPLPVVPVGVQVMQPVNTSVGGVN